MASQGQSKDELDGYKSEQGSQSRIRGKENLENDGRLCYECNRSLAKSPQLINITGLDHKWHPECFKCRLCDQPLDRENSCFLYKDGVVCREDYAKLRTDSLTKCSRCQWPIGSNDWVRRAGEFIYHLACFSCDMCFRQLSTGEQFTINGQDGGSVRLLCRLHFEIEPSNRTNCAFNQREATTEELVSSLIGDQDTGQHHALPRGKSLPTGHTMIELNGDEFRQLASTSQQTAALMLDKRLANTSTSHQEDIFTYQQLQEAHLMDKDQQQQQQHSTRLPLATANSSSNGSHLGGQQSSSIGPAPSSTSSNSSSSNKSKRVRTTFTEEQLQILQSHFQLDSNPDGQDLERIATVTGLSKRVTQVWFQNSRARQKKHFFKRKPGPLSGAMGLAGTSSSNDCPPGSSANSMQYNIQNSAAANHQRIGPTGHECFSVQHQSWSPNSGNMRQETIDAENLDDETHLSISSSSPSSVVSSSRSLSRSSMNEDHETHVEAN